MRTHYRLTEDCVSDSLPTHPRKGREGKGIRKGFCAHFPKPSHLSNACEEMLSRHATWNLVLAGLVLDEPQTIKGLTQMQTLRVAAYDQYLLNGWFRKFITEDEHGCWIWGGARFRNGYGAIGYHGSTRCAHRVIYELMVEAAIDHLDLDHLCRNRACVRPDHLEPVSRSVNLTRGAHPTQGRLGREGAA